MKLEELMMEWEKDCKIDWTEPSKAAIGIPSLHNKYLQEFIRDRMKYRKLQGELKELSVLKTQYYSGHLNNKEDLDELGWEPWEYTKGNRANVEKFISGDSDIRKLTGKIEYLEEKLGWLDTVMKQITNMSFNIGNFIKWEMFTNGAN